MRILRVSALFTMLLITRGGCRPNDRTNNLDYASDGTDYDQDYPDTNQPDNSPGAVSSQPVIFSHIHTRPVKVEVAIGEEVHLPCNVSNPKEVAVVWKKGSSILYSDDLSYLSDTESTRIVRLSNNTLIISNFRKSDVSDQYICEISNPEKEQVVHSIQLKKDVQVLPNSWIVLDKTEQDVTLRCLANWEPKPKISWSRMGQSLKSDTVPEDGSSLTVKNVTVDNAGLYQCMAEIGANTNPIVKAIRIDVNHAPIVAVENDIVHTGIHMDAELICSVSAYPQAQVKWFKNQKKVSGTTHSDQSNVGFTTYTLVLHRIEKEHFGKYNCEASNPKGVASGTVELTGVPKPAELKHGKVNEDGTTPILEWEVKSYSPILEYKLKYRSLGDKDWRVVSPPVTDDGTSNTFTVTYPIENLKAGDYEALLTAKNEFGWSPEPLKPYKIHGENVITLPDIAAESKSGSASTQSCLTLRSFLLAVSLFVYAATCL